MAPLDVVFTNFDVVEPDLLFVSRHRAADILTAAHVTGAPDVVVEIGSPSTRKRDETIKRRVYRNEDGRFERPLELRADTGDVLTSPDLDGFEMPLGRIFAE